MILAGIGKLGDETVLSRSIVIQMRRKLPHERTERFRPSRIAAEVADVTRKAARWSDDAARAVRDLPEPACPDDMGSRAWDNLEVLARIAAVIGGHWPDRLQVAIAALHGRDGAGSGTTPVHLLFDIVAIVQARAAKRALASWHDIAIRSEELLAELLEFGDGQWNEVGAPPRKLTLPRIAKMLESFGIRSMKTDCEPSARIVAGSGSQRRRHAAYRLRHFVEPFERHGGDAELARRQAGSIPTAAEQAELRCEIQAGALRLGPAGRTPRMPAVGRPGSAGAIGVAASPTAQERPRTPEAEEMADQAGRHSGAPLPQSEIRLDLIGFRQSGMSSAAYSPTGSPVAMAGEICLAEPAGRETEDDGPRAAPVALGDPDVAHGGELQAAAAEFAIGPESSDHREEPDQQKD